MVFLDLTMPELDELWYSQQSMKGKAADIQPEAKAGKSWDWFLRVSTAKSTEPLVCYGISHLLTEDPALPAGNWSTLPWAAGGHWRVSSKYSSVAGLQAYVWLRAINLAKN